MSSPTTDLRSFIRSIPGLAITEVCNNFVPEAKSKDAGFIWYKTSNTAHERTFEQSGLPEKIYYDLEIYHEDPAVVESVAFAIQALDCYNGDFGDGHVGAFFAEDQVDDYVPQAQFTEEELLESAYLAILVQGYRSE